MDTAEHWAGPEPVLSPRGQLSIIDTDATVMNVIGFREAHEAALTVSIPEGVSVNVPPLHGLVLLKLSAWADRRLIPPLGEDAHDIRLLFKHYLEATLRE